MNNLRFSGGRVYEWEFKVDGHMRKFLPTARLTLRVEPLWALTGWIVLGAINIALAFAVSFSGAI